MQRLDDTDAEIVRALQEDGRMPYGELAERTGLSETQARRRVRALIDADIISLTTIADPRVFGLDWMAWVALSARQADASDIAEQLIRIPAINYVILAAGHADVFAEVACRSVDELRAVLTEIRAIRGVRRSDTLVFLALMQQRYEWGPARTIPDLHPLNTGNVRAELDDLDLKIIRTLAIDGRASFRRMSHDLGVSQRLIAQRFNRLTQDNTIRVSAVANPTNLGFDAMAWVGVHLFAGADFETVAAELGALPEVSYLAAIAGSYDLMVEVACRDRDELLRTLSEKISAIDGIDHIDSAIYLKILYRRTMEPWSGARSLPLTRIQEES